MHFLSVTGCGVVTRSDVKSQRVLPTLRLGLGFPGGTVVESPPADAGDAGLCPGPGRSHMPRSGWAREPWPLSLRVQNLCSATGEATTARGPRTAKKKKRKPNVSHNLKVQELDIWGVPGGAVVGSPPADAGDAGLCPGPGGSRMPRSGWACAPEPVLRNGRGHNSERPACHKKK